MVIEVYLQRNSPALLLIAVNRRQSQLANLTALTTIGRPTFIPIITGIDTAQCTAKAFPDHLCIFSIEDMLDYIVKCYYVPAFIDDQDATWQSIDQLT